MATLQHQVLERKVLDESRATSEGRQHPPYITYACFLIWIEPVSMVTGAWGPTTACSQWWEQPPLFFSQLLTISNSTKTSNSKTSKGSIISITIEKYEYMAIMGTLSVGKRTNFNGNFSTLWAHKSLRTIKHYTYLTLKWSGSIMFNSSWPHGLSPLRLLCPWNSPARILGSHSLLQGIFPTQGLNLVSCITGGLFTI